MGLKMKEIPINERPIERLINVGSDNLSNEELLAILIKTGTRKCSAKDIASLVLKECNGNLNNINYQMLKNIEGLGNVKSANIIAALELGKRANRKIDNINNKQITSAELVFEYYRDIVFNKKQEYFYCIYLDSNKKVLKEKLLFVGTLDYSLVHPREVFKEAYSISASSIICVHNHPSGNVIPSKNDFELTTKLIEIGNIFGIKIVDHVIIGDNKYYSFVENGDM
ncbi:MAG: DNA repair protein RadC [Bacilli bacterium]|nr:DNA repair protein RadC [Bacilli bacterium]